MTKRTSEIEVGIDLNKAIERVDFDALDPNLRALIRLLLNSEEIHRDTTEAQEVVQLLEAG